MAAPTNRLTNSTEKQSGKFRRCPAWTAWPSARRFRGAVKAIWGPGFQFSADGHVRAGGEEDPRAMFRTVSPGFFAALGVPIISGRDFNDSDRSGTEKVAIVSESVAKRMFPGQDAVGHHMWWTDPVVKFVDISEEPRRIVGVTPDIDDENIVPGP